MPTSKLQLLDLTEREHDVARLLVEGFSNKVIADRLAISTHTAKFHIRNFIIKMNARTRVDAAVKYALATMLTTPTVHAPSVVHEETVAA